MLNKQAVIEAPTKQDLLEEYQVGDFFMETPKRALLGKGFFMEVPADEEHDNQMEGLSQRISFILKKAKEQGHSRPVVIGAVPFDHERKASLYIPKNVQFGPSFQKEERKAEMSTPIKGYHLTPVPEPEEYKKGVAAGIEKIQSGQLDKIVLSRALELNTNEPIHIPGLLGNLARQNKYGYTFAAGVHSGQQLSTLIGASPELLVSKEGMKLTANPLAGSRPRSTDPIEDQRRAKELLSSAKDLHEHAVVVKAVEKALRPFCKTIKVPEMPSLITTEAMWHLSTVIEGELLDSETSSLDLAVALHPTPAVCGTPTETARQAIAEIEPFDRSFFTGMIGWCDDKGDGEWVVTIRCAEVQESSLRLFAGAGVVGASKPEEELAETGAKFQTMLRAMGMDTQEI